MSEIMTVLGPIAPEELGFTSMHEHILYDGSVYRRRYEAFLPERLPVAKDEPVTLGNLGLLKHNFIMSWDAVSMHDEEVMTAEVADFKTSGGNALVDMSAPGLRSNLPAIQRISLNSGVHVVATTGLYTEDSWPERFREMTVEQYADYMGQEIERGIEDTGIRPGHIKIAITDRSLPNVPPFSKQQEKLLRAAARVSGETGVSVTVHPGFDDDTDGRRIVRVLVEEGMNPVRAIIAHAEAFFVEHDLKTLVLNPESWSLRLDYAKEVLDRGANLSIDCFGHFWDPESRGFILETDWQRLAGVVALVKAGYSGQLVLGTDTFIKILTRRFGGEGYCRLTNFVVPTLRRMDVSESDIRRLTVDNPANLLAR